MAGRIPFPEPLGFDLIDFQAANYNADQKDIIIEALREHIDRRLQEPAMKERFEQAREKRLGVTEAANVTVLKTGK